MTDKIDLARAWYQAKEKLDIIKAQERELREEVVASYFGDNPPTGTSKEDLNIKTQLVLVRNATLDVDKDEFVKYEGQLRAAGLIGPDGLIQMVPKVSLSAYKKLPDDAKARFSSVFKHGVSSPQLKTVVRKD